MVTSPKILESPAVTWISRLKVYSHHVLGTLSSVYSHKVRAAHSQSVVNIRFAVLAHSWGPSPDRMSNVGETVNDRAWLSERKLPTP